MQDKKIVAIIPARGGSKGIYKKNIRLVNGRPLIYYQIDAALKSKYISEVVVSTDCDLIADVVHNYPDQSRLSVVWRHSSESDDYARSEAALKTVCSVYENSLRIIIDIIVFLQATSPLNRTEYIDKAIEKVLTEEVDSCCMTTEDFGFYINTQEIIDRPRRQDSTPAIRECGNGWVMTRESLFINDNRLDNRLGRGYGYILIPKEDALDIDSLADLELASILLKKRERKESGNYFRKRIPAGVINYEDNYWGKTIDPDGKERNKEREKWQYLEDAKHVIDYINTQEPGAVLSVGCGFGYILSAINGKWLKYGTELSEYAGEKAREYGNIHIGCLLESPYPDMSFEAINMYHVIEHLPDPVVYIQKINNLLKIGGKLIITTPDFESITAKRFGDKFRLLHDKTHVSLFGTQGLCNMLEDYGFEVEKVEHPFYGTRHETEENLLRLMDTTKISPPAHGNVVTIFAHKC
jgi:CMP-N-acetylneuraminic acid synthetase/SAM-dependent methyltransferase